jgi:hypothetical protein
MIPFGLSSLMTVSLSLARRATKCLPPGAVALYLPVVEGQNLLKYSQQFDNAAWTKTRSSITPNVALAPDGTMTADKLVEDVTPTSTHSTSQSPTGLIDNGLYTYSIYIAAGERTWARVQALTKANTLVYYYVNLATGGIGTTFGSPSPTVVAVGGGWYRCSLSVNIASGATQPLFAAFIADADNNVTIDGNGASGIYLWDAQLREGTDPGDYYPTTDKQILMDYSRPRKNLLLPTIANAGEDGTTSAFATWGTGVTLSSSTEQFWQGSRSLKVVCDGTVAGQGQYYQWYTYGLSPGKTYTGSVYVKGTAGATLALNLVERTDTGAGTGGGANVNFTATGGWDRVVATFTAGATGRCANMRVTVNGTLATTFYCDGFQLEEGSVATAWEAPPNHGILGSALGSVTNDPIWVREGLRYEEDDYVKFGPISDSTGTVQPMGATVTAFYVPSSVSAASAKSCSFALAPNAAIYLGAVAGAPANNIITVQYDAAGSYTSWCDAAATITAGWHTLAVAWNGTAYDIYLDGAMLPTTTAGTPALLSPTAANCCYDGTTYGPGIVRAARGIWARSLGAGELAQARAYLKGYLAKFGVALP